VKSASAAEQITRRSQSNLALAFIALPRDRRHDISVFYAFCRLVDDLADEPGRDLTERRHALEIWRASLRGVVPNEPPLAAEMRALIAKHNLSVALLEEIITGVEMDLAETVFGTFEQLALYCYRVAGVVGLISIEIFGCREEACHQYALDLGTALQLTNILRDVGQDYANDRRIYLPQDEIARFGYSSEALARGERTPEFHALMQFAAHRAWSYFRNAEKMLPRSERRRLAAAEIMRAIYEKLLARMQRDGFDVFRKRYRLSRLEKAICIARVLLSRAPANVRDRQRTRYLPEFL
jgi:phytoene synthase